MWLLSRSTRIRTVKEPWNGPEPTAFPPFGRKRNCSTTCWCANNGMYNNLCSVNLRPWMLVRLSLSAGLPLPYHSSLSNALPYFAIISIVERLQSFRPLNSSPQLSGLININFGWQPGKEEMFGKNGGQVSESWRLLMISLYGTRRQKSITTGGMRLKNCKSRVNSLPVALSLSFVWI